MKSKIDTSLSKTLATKIVRFESLLQWRATESRQSRNSITNDFIFVFLFVLELLASSKPNVNLEFIASPLRNSTRATKLSNGLDVFPSMSIWYCRPSLAMIALLRNDLISLLPTRVLALLKGSRMTASSEKRANSPSISLDFILLKYWFTIISRLFPFCKLLFSFNQTTLNSYCI